jgi:uncharacterized protein YbjT (DUF2867 family)
MDLLIFGATGMVGQGVLRESLRHPAVTTVRSVGRTPTGVTHPNLIEIIRADLFHYQDIEPQLTDLDACFFCLGVSSAQVSPAEYERLTYTLTLAAAETLARLNPQMTFIYVSGAGTDSTERGSSAWARVKGKTENTLLRLPFRAYMFRPAIIRPVGGEISKTPAYRLFYTLGKPVLPLLERLFPRYFLTTTELGLAMINVALHGAPKRVLESIDIRHCALASHP